MEQWVPSHCTPDFGLTPQCSEEQIFDNDELLSSSTFCDSTCHCNCTSAYKGVFTAYIMLLIAMSFYERRRRNLRAKLDTVINSLSANHACLKTLLHIDYSQYFDVVDRTAMTYVTTLGYQMFKFWHSISIADINNLTSHIIIIVRYFFRLVESVIYPDP